MLFCRIEDVVLTHTYLSVGMLTHDSANAVTRFSERLPHRVLRPERSQIADYMEFFSDLQRSKRKGLSYQPVLVRSLRGYAMPGVQTGKISGRERICRCRRARPAP